MMNNIAKGFILSTLKSYQRPWLVENYDLSIFFPNKLFKLFLQCYYYKCDKWCTNVHVVLCPLSQNTLNSGYIPSLLKLYTNSE